LGTLDDQDGAVAVVDAVVAGAADKGSTMHKGMKHVNTNHVLPLERAELSGSDNEHVGLDGLDIVDNLVTDLTSADDHLALDLALQRERISFEPGAI